MKQLKLNKKTVANLSKSSMKQTLGGASDTQCFTNLTAPCETTHTNSCPSQSLQCNPSGFLECISIEGTVCQTSNDVRCVSQGCTEPTTPLTHNCTNGCK